MLLAKAWGRSAQESQLSAPLAWGPPGYCPTMPPTLTVTQFPASLSCGIPRPPEVQGGHRPIHQLDTVTQLHDLWLTSQPHAQPGHIKV